MADWYGFDRQVGDEDFEEGEVWAVLKERKDGSPKARKSKDSSISTAPRRLPTASRLIPRRSNPNVESSGRPLQQSAPVNIPDWSKIYRKKGSSESQRFRSGHGGIGGEDEGNVRGANDLNFDVDVDDDDDDDEDEQVPPHEWIAKKLARSQISSFSVCEGAGRTLKGRDLSKVRNAVLTKTGFLE